MTSKFDQLYHTKVLTKMLSDMDKSVVLYSPRDMGKTSYYQTLKLMKSRYYGTSSDHTISIRNVVKLTDTVVDGAKWYTVMILPEVYQWVKEQGESMYYVHRDEPFHIKVDVHETLYTAMLLKWT